MSETRDKIRIEAMEHLAAGIARDLSGILTVLNGNAHLLLNRKSADPIADQSIRQIYIASHDAARIAGDLRALAHGNVLQKGNLDLGQLIENLAPLMRPALGETVALDLRLDPLVPAIRADAGLMEHLLMNLVSVASIFMPAGGTLTFGTELASAGDVAKQNDQPAAGAGFACLRAGFDHWFVPPGALPGMFEPFSSAISSGPAHSPGLRLAAVRGIVEQHGGTLEAASEPGPGTTLMICLPLARPERAAPAADGTGSPPRENSRAPVTVLLVEDEDAVRDLGAILLKDLGCRVLQADSGKAALEIWKWYGDRIQILFTDLALPGDLTGLDLARTFQAERPGLKVILTSGSLEIAAEDTRDWPRKPRFIQKPYTLQRLEAIMHEALADHGSANPVTLRPAKEQPNANSPLA